MRMDFVSLLQQIVCGITPSEPRRRNRVARKRPGFFDRLEDRTLLAALTFGTTSFDDDSDQFPGDGMCATAMGDCTFRAAIQEANAHPGPDTINLTAGTYTLTRAGANEDAADTGDWDITGDVDINGAGATATIIDAAGLDRALHILFTTVNISGVTITNGSAASGGGIYNDAGTLTITDSIVSGNTAQGTAGSSGAGGGIYDFVGSVTMTGSTISNNQAIGDSGGDGFGGGIYSDGGSWMVSQSTLSGNMARGGAAAAGAGGQSGFGGGLFTVFATFTIDASTLSNNQALGSDGDTGTTGGSGFGGGIYLDFLSTVTATNSTLSGNRATGGNGPAGSGGNGSGGGIHNAGGATVSLLHATIADNHATGGSGGSPGSGNAGGIGNDDTAILKSTIVATNTASTGDSDVLGFFVSLSHNLIGDGGSSVGFGAAGDQVGTSGSPVDPLLGPLQNNGGPTLTHELLAGSPAIDTADNIGAPSVDQRGEPRPVDGDGNSTAIVDIGAYEAAPGQVVLASLSGVVYVDANNNGLRDDGATGINGVMIQLTGIDDLGSPVSLTTSTMTLAGVPGSYDFTGLRPSGTGGYTLTETQPAGYLDGKDTLGTPGGVASNDMFSNIVLNSGVNGVENNFGELQPACLSGTVYVDYNDNGIIDTMPAAEPGISGVLITVTGTNDLGQSVTTTATTTPSGIFNICSLRPGTYKITETQPAGYLDGIDTRGTINGVPSGTVSNDMFSGLTLASGAAGINYNFGERPSGTTLKSGQTATIGFWKNNNGQALLNTLNGGSIAKKLSEWLASNFPRLWGSSAGANNLSGKTNAQVAAYYANLFRTNDSPKAETQAMATAFAVYATSSSLAGGSYATAYGFIVTSSGTGSAKFNVMNNGAAFGVSNNSVLKILDLLKKSNDLAVNGVLNGGNAAKRKMSNVVYSAINETGDIL